MLREQMRTKHGKVKDESSQNGRTYTVGKDYRVT